MEVEKGTAALRGREQSGGCAAFIRACGLGMEGCSGSWASVLRRGHAALIGVRATEAEGATRESGRGARSPGAGARAQALLAIGRLCPGWLAAVALQGPGTPLLGLGAGAAAAWAKGGAGPPGGLGQGEELGLASWAGARQWRGAGRPGRAGRGSSLLGLGERARSAA